jgi:hypothetical protein
MTTAKELRIWAVTMRWWIAEIEDGRTGGALTRAAAEVERLAELKQTAERQHV